MVQNGRIERVIGALTIAAAISLMAPSDSIFWHLTKANGGTDTWALMMIVLGVITVIASVTSTPLFRIACMLVSMFIWSLIIWVYFHASELAPLACIALPTVFWAALRTVEIWQKKD